MTFAATWMTDTRMRAARLLGAFWLLIMPAAAPAVVCGYESFEGARYAVCEIDLRHDALRLFLNAPDGTPFGDFDTLSSALAAQGDSLIFAMNGGMYHADRRPVGHYVEDGVEARGVISSAGPGNFGMLPNGVLCIADGTARVIETRAYLAERPACDHATQSGPMLVIDGALHPRFIPGSPSRFLRNGVGTSDDGRRAVFAISQGAVSFHGFARFFRDHLGLNQALYLDGNVSRLFAPALGRDDPGRPMGPIVAVTAPMER
jgi:uncharacterized protein YigE (DUF2233 family)